MSVDPTTWPTSEQFDKAAENGHEYALAEYSNGATQAQESVLSGEWADGPSPRQIAGNVGFHKPAEWSEETDYNEGVDELANAWERGYNDAWAHSLPSEA